MPTSPSNRIYESLIMISAYISNDQRKFYQTQGYVLLPGLLDVSMVQLLRKEVMSIMQVIGLGKSKLRQTTQYLAGSFLDRLINSQELKALAENLLDGPATLFMPFTAVKSAGDGGKFHFHQDNQYTEFDGPGINFWFALDDMSEANGCLWIVPRSHLNGTLPAESSGDGDQHKKISWVPEDAIPLLMQPGACVAFSRLTIHGSGQNTTALHRVAYAMQFHCDDVLARRSGEPWRLLKDHPRWPVAPVMKITSPEKIK